MELFVWDGDWDLYSADPYCLQVLAYVRLSGAPVAVSTCNNPRLSPSGELPFLQDGSELIAGAWAIIHHLKRKGYNADAHLEASDRARITAYWQHAESCLGAVIARDRFDSSGYAETRLWMARRLPFPLNFMVPSQLAQQAIGRHIAHMQGRGMYPTPSTDMTPRAIAKITEGATDFAALGTTGTHVHASESYQDPRHPHSDEALTARLGVGNRYLFGNRPTTLDAVLYGHFMFAMKCNQPRCILFASLLEDRALEPIVSMCRAFGDEAMPGAMEFLSPSELETNLHRQQSGDGDADSVVGYVKDDMEGLGWRVQEKSAEEKNKEDLDEAAQARRAYITAALAMVGYAVFQGARAVQKASSNRGGSRHAHPETEDDYDYEH